MQLLDLIIIYHSRTNGTEQMATAAFDAIILELKQIRRKLSGKRQPLPYYGRVDTLLEQMHDTLRDFNQSH